MAAMELEDDEGGRIHSSSDQQFKIRGASYTCPNCSTQQTIGARSTGSDPSKAGSSSPGQLSATPVPAQHNGSSDGGQVDQVRKGTPRANKDDTESTEAWKKDITGWVAAVSSAVISSTFNGAVNFRKLPRWGKDFPVEELYIIFGGLAFYIAVFTILLLFSGRTAPGTWKFIALNFCVALQLTSVAIVICATLFKSVTTIVVPNIIIWFLFVLLWIHRSLWPRARQFWKVDPTADS